MVEMQSQELSSREGNVLVGLVDEYIRSARPVGSEQLVRTLRLDMSPATVRNIFRVLEDEQYVIQPHTSAGRIPTDRGYRYYVDAAAAARISRRQLARLEALLDAFQQQYHSPAQVVARALAQATGGLAAVSWLREHDTHQAGFAALARQFANIPTESMCEVLEMLDNLEGVVTQLSEREDPQPYVYIGRENPVMPAKHTSLVVRRVHSPQQDVLLLIVGPKHMPYRRNVAWLQEAAAVVEEFDL